MSYNTVRFPPITALPKPGPYRGETGSQKVVGKGKQRTSRHLQREDAINAFVKRLSRYATETEDSTHRFAVPAGVLCTNIVGPSGRTLLKPLSWWGVGGRRTPFSFSRIAKKKRRRATPPYLAYLFSHPFHTFSEKIVPRSSQVRSPGQANWPYLLKCLGCYSSYSFWAIDLKFSAYNGIFY